MLWPNINEEHHYLKQGRSLCFLWLTGATFAQGLRRPQPKAPRLRLLLAVKGPGRAIERYFEIAAFFILLVDQFIIGGPDAGITAEAETQGVADQ